MLRGVDANQPLFLRVSKPGHATTNTSYLNPRGPKENVRILLLTEPELHSLPPTRASAPSAVQQHRRRREAGRRPEPDGIPGRHDAVLLAGRQNPTGADRRDHGDQIPTLLPPQDNDREPNVIVTANPLAKDIVMPVFAGQVTYAVIRE